MLQQQAPTEIETVQAPGSSRSVVPLLLAAVFILMLAALQAFFLLPSVASGNAFDVSLGDMPLEPPYRVDALTLTFGLLWCFGGALVAVMLAVLTRRRPVWTGNNRNTALFLCVMSAGLIHLAYARSLLWFYAGWEVVGLALWFALIPLWSYSRPLIMLLLHLPGWALWIAGLFYQAVFAPPTGGTATPWPPMLATALALACFARASCWPFNMWARRAQAEAGIEGAMLIGLYISAAPYLMARALAAAPWSPRETWALAMVGTIAVVAAATSTLGKSRPFRLVAVQSATAAAAIVGLGMASGAPVAGAGALLLMMTSALSPALWASYHRPWIPLVTSWIGVFAGASGAWAIAQGSLQLGYGVVAAVMLAAGALIAFAIAEPLREPGPRRARATTIATGTASVLLLAGIFPQGVLVWLVQPALGAMPGGVNVPRGLQGVWSLGVLITASGETLVAALPATGIAVAVIALYALLRWLSPLFRLLGGEGDAEAETERPERIASIHPTMSDILPGSEQAGALLDPLNLVAKVRARSRDEGGPG